MTGGSGTCGPQRTIQRLSKGAETWQQARDPQRRSHAAP